MNLSIIHHIIKIKEIKNMKLKLITEEQVRRIKRETTFRYKQRIEI